MSRDGATATALMDRLRGLLTTRGLIDAAEVHALLSHRAREVPSIVEGEVPALLGLLSGSRSAGLHVRVARPTNGLPSDVDPHGAFGDWRPRHAFGRRVSLYAARGDGA